MLKYRLIDIMDFYGIVIAVAIVMFILLLTLMGVLISRSTSTRVFPPTMGSCPDYWSVDSSGNCHFPSTPNAVNRGLYANKNINGSTDKNVLNSAPYPNTTKGLSWTFDPKDSRWASASKTAVCAQRDWAIKHNIVWDGISNYNSC